MATVGSENTLVDGSMPAMMLEMVAATSSYSVKLAKPCFLAMLSSSACIFGIGLVRRAALQLLGEGLHVLLRRDEPLDMLLGQLDLLGLGLCDADDENCAKAIATNAAITSRSACCMGVFLVCRSRVTR